AMVANQFKDKGKSPSLSTSRFKVTELTARRCLRHHSREAAALCKKCNQFFCRECISEHDGQLLCTRCLNADAKEQKKGHGLFSRAFETTAALFGLLILWMVFFYLGKFLLTLPTSFHDGSIWNNF
ncbi:MAG: B-box zinc finger protein, partial [Desulfuromonadales bacterium]|nr:B-box zinc finger protein [Desulfuromonadales bacterium]